MRKIVFTIINTLLLLPLVTLAQGPGTGEGGNPPSGSIVIRNPLDGINSLQGFIQTVIENIVLPIGGVVVVIFIIYSGFLFVTAQGNEQKLQKAKVNFLYVVIGTAVLLGSWVIATVIEATINQITTP